MFVTDVSLFCKNARMKIGVFLLLGFLFYTAADAQLPVGKEPHHKVILQNAYFRLLDGHIPAHDTTPAHLHAANSVVIFLSGSRFGIQTAGDRPVITDVHAGDMKYADYGDKPVTHTVWNESPSMFHFYVVELARPHTTATPCPILRQPGLSYQWRQPAVQAYYLDLVQDRPCRLPASHCARLLIDVSGTTTATSAEGTHTRQPEGFVFFPPGGRIDIRGSHARCILLEME